MALIEALAEQRFDDGLAADVQLLCEAVQLVEHGGGEIHVDALDGLHAAAGIGEEPRDILAAIGHAGDGFGGYGLFLTRRVFQKVFALRGAVTESRGGITVIPQEKNAGRWVVDSG